MDPSLLAPKLARLAGLRGDPTKGLSPADWASALESCPLRPMIQASVDIVQELIMDEWRDRRPTDRRPDEGIAAIRAWLSEPSEESVKRLKASSKDCTAAKNETYGDGHRVPHAVRLVAKACTKESTEEVFEALQTVEEELLSRIAVFSEFHKAPEQRKAILTRIERVLSPAPVSKAPERRSTEPVAYSPAARFSVDQCIMHTKFGPCTVVSVGETWVEVELSDRSRKRLAHRPL